MDRLKSFFAQKRIPSLKIGASLNNSRNYPVIEAALPAEFSLREIDKELLNKITGKITPSFSWDNDERFLEKGKGYCVTDGNNAAAWAFLRR